MSVAANLRTFQATLGLSAACAGMAVVVWWQFNPAPVRGPAPQVAAARMPSSVDPPKAEARAQPTKQAFATISERFLFHPTRRPPPPKPPMVAPRAPPPVVSPLTLQPYTLIGIVMSGDIKVALFRTAGGSNVVQLSEGENLQGWTVRRIADDRVVFRAGATEHAVEFPREPSAPAQTGGGPAVFVQPAMPQPAHPTAQPAPIPSVR